MKTHSKFNWDQRSVKYHSVIMAGPWKVPFSYHGWSMEFALPKLKPRREVAELVMVRSVQGVVDAVPSPYILFYPTIYKISIPM